MSCVVPEQDRTVRTGLPGVGTVPWGTHLCHFYRAVEDLRDPLLEFFRVGLANNEQCLWVASKPLPAAEARAALSRTVPDLAEYERTGQVVIVDVENWYTPGGRMDNESVVRKWLAAERDALAAGFSGLRVTGNVSWLRLSDWDDFVSYEAAVHEAFHGRRMLALCSYGLGDCTPDTVLDVLRNHEFALIRREGEWHLVRSATELLSAVDTEGLPAGIDHRARFFREDQYPADVIARFLAQAPEGSALAIATPAHLQAIRAELAKLGVDPQSLIAHDAEQALAWVLEADSDQRMRELVGGYVEQVCRGRPHAKPHVYGELVNLFSAMGRKNDALRLEKVWNEQLREHRFSLWCGYDLAHFDDDNTDVFAAVCTCHTGVHREGAAHGRHPSADELLARREFERERALLLEAERHANARLARLQRITSALSEAVTCEDVRNLAAGPVCMALNADAVRLVMADTPDGEMPAGASALDRVTIEALQTGASRWHDEDAALERFGETAGARALAAVPLKVHGRRLGAAGFAFSAPQRFQHPQRALIEDACNQISLALERALLYEEAGRQRNAAESAARAKDQFIATLGHELRNPLAALQTAAELLAMYDSDPEKLLRIHGILVRQTSHMAKLIEDLLDVSRIVWGKITLTRCPLDLTALVTSVLEDQRESVERRGIVLQSALEPAPMWVHGDRVRLVQVVDNILSNAVKFTPHGGSVTLSLQRAGQYAVLTLRDTGAGVDPGLLPRIFEPFQQAGQDLARSSGGLGLGLTLVKGLVDLHGGAVQVSSPGPGGGCEVTVRLPLTEERAGILDRAAGPVGRRRVLVVEDNRDAAELLAELLRLDGHIVTVAYDADQALSLAPRFAPQIVLCDLGLPGTMNGFDLAAALRTELKNGAVRLIALSGYGSPSDLTRAHDSGFDRHLTKPVDLQTLRGVFAEA